jgi:adenylosuccinate lyase
LERTLDDSANRRSLLPEAFLIADELLIVADRILSGLQVNEKAIHRNLEVYAPFAALERVLVALSKAGADRLAMHERLRGHSMQAWEAVQAGKPNPLLQQLVQDEEIQRYLGGIDTAGLMDASRHLGAAPGRARKLAAAIRRQIEATNLSE